MFIDFSLLKDVADCHFKLVTCARFKNFRFQLQRVLYNLALRIPHFDYDKAKTSF